MSDDNKSFPEIKQDRRRRAKSREGFSDRRQHVRYLGSFPVQIHVGDGPDAKVYQAVARDISNGGLALEVPDLPSDEKRFRVEFKIPDGVMPEEFLHQTVVMDAEARFRDDRTGTLGVAFTEPLSRRLGRSTWNYLRWAAVLFLFLALSATLLIKYENLYFFWFDVPVFLYSILVGAYLISRFLFASLYGVSKPRPDEPTVTIVIPVHNEEQYIERTLKQVMESAYPADKLQAIVVNDGSTDGTLEAINRARKLYPELILVNFSESRGKRNAMAAGIKMATGEIVIFIDSDSFLEPEAIRNLTDRFVDPEVASVTGHCDVENIWTNTLTRMQAVRYYVAFRVMKAAESIFDSVTCLSGPLAAYRRDVLLTVVDEWVTQTFLGKPATFGDDRSLTNSLLRRGYKVVYESRARTTTIVPESYAGFMKQQIRWKRSWFRESLRAAVFMWRKQPLMSLSFYLGFLLPIVAPAIVARALIYVPVFQQASPLTYIFGVFLMSALMSSVYLFARRSRLWYYGVYFCFFYMFILVWQLPWAILTFWKTEWGTRS